MHIAPDVQQALEAGRPIVALETAVLTHGLPYPENLTTMQAMVDAVRAQGAVPAVIGVLAGVPTVGLEPHEWHQLLDDPWKCSIRDLAVAAVRGRHGGTTVAATAWIAHRAGIRVFATGGIGGVHRGFAEHLDISADLPALARLPLVVVSAGAKSILDVSATLEVLETLSVAVVGYRTDRFPGFYVADAGHTLDRTVDTPEDAARIRRHMDELGLSQALLLVQPAPSPVDPAPVEAAIADALATMRQEGVTGKAVTPYLLDRLNRQAGSALKATNIGLLVANARLAADVAVALAL